MTKHSGVQLAIELATKQRDMCQRRVAILDRQSVSAQGQMEQLRGYAADKDAGWIDSAPGIFSGELIRHQYQFVERLQQAIGMQAELLGQVDAEVSVARTALANAQIRLEGLNRILKLRLSAKELLLTRREQKQTDDFASQQFARKRVEMEQGEAG